jgi:hypothetical protein
MFLFDVAHRGRRTAVDTESKIVQSCRDARTFTQCNSFGWQRCVLKSCEFPRGGAAANLPLENRLGYCGSDFALSLSTTAVTLTVIAIKLISAVAAITAGG